MKRRNIPTGTRVRLKPAARLFSGWCGTATMLFTRSVACVAIKDGYTETSGTHPGTERSGSAMALPEHWTVIRDQTPNPEHADAVRRVLAKARRSG